MSRVPAIRFKGFTDPWEQRKLGEVAKVFDGVHQTPDYVDEGVMFLSVENIGTLKSNKYISREDYIRDYKTRPEKGDIFMTRIGDVGTSNVVKTDDELAYYVSLALIKPQMIDSFFLNSVICSLSFQKSLRTKTLTTAVPQKINKEEIGNIELTYPSSLQEQLQIGTFFQQLDSLITLHQRKYDKLCTVKKSMLDKMFPKPGELVPEIRFEGFTDPWEQRKLGEVASLLGGNAWSSKEYDPSGDYLVITIANVTGEYEVDDSEGNRINVNGNSEYLLSHGDILVSLTGNVGRVSRMTSTKAVLNQRVGKLSVDCDIDDEFIFQAIRDGRFLTTMETASQGAAQKNISNSDVLSFELLLPTLKEQQVVGEALHRIDTLITLHQRKLELLKNVKKSLLDKMFV